MRRIGNQTRTSMRQTPRCVLRDAEDARRLLKSRQIVPTPRRVMLLERLYQEFAPLPAEVFVQKLKGKMDMVTVYRTLRLFEEQGIVERVNLRKERDYFELAPLRRRGHHHHLVCRKCGVLEDVAVSEPRSFERRVLDHSKNFREITSHALEFFGLCRVCVRR